MKIFKGVAVAEPDRMTRFNLQVYKGGISMQYSLHVSCHNHDR